MDYNPNFAVVIGYGVVGRATAKLFDIKDYFDLKGSTMSLRDIAKEKRYIFICLPTPVGTHGHKTDDIEAIITQLHQQEAGPGKLFILRSTVTPGFAQRVSEALGCQIVSNPEFLTMRTITEDTVNPDIVVIGTKLVNVQQEVHEMYRTQLKKYGEAKPHYFITDNTTAEFIKLAINVFYALKVIYANQLYDIVKVAGANYDTIASAMYARKWIGENHLDVLFNGVRGVGGNCLKKDLEAFNKAFQLPLLMLAEKLNTQKYHGRTE